MKKIIALVMTLMLLCGFAALAETDGNTKMHCQIEEGSYIIQIDDPEGDLGWAAESEDEDVVALYDADLIEDTFVIRFDPVADGDATVVVHHYYTGFAADEMYGWDLRVEGGKVTENLGGIALMSNSDEGDDELIAGEWVGQNDPTATLSVVKNDNRGWDVEARVALSDGESTFKTTVYDDVERGFVYDKGKFWDVPTDEGAELGEAKIAGETGVFTIGVLDDDDETLTLTWHDDALEGDVTFVRAASEN